MIEPFIGQIAWFAGDFIPTGGGPSWVLCNGALLPIKQYEALFTYMGTAYGGDGVTTFGVPNLIDSVPVGAGRCAGSSTTYTVGMQGGTALLKPPPSAIPAHTHTVTMLADTVIADAQLDSPVHAVLCDTGSYNNFSIGTPDGTMAAGMTEDVMPLGGTDNLQPYQQLVACICYAGIQPNAKDASSDQQEPN